MRKFQRQGNKNLVPVVLENGIQALINPCAISEKDWTRHHGKTAGGVEVNSLETYTVDESTLIRTGRGKLVLSVPTDDLEVFAKQFLAGKNYGIVAPQQ